MTNLRIARQPETPRDQAAQLAEDRNDRHALLIEHLGFTEAEAAAFIDGDQAILATVAARRMTNGGELTVVDDGFTH